MKKSILAFAVIAVLGFVSCSQEDSNLDDLNVEQLPLIDEVATDGEGPDGDGGQAGAGNN